MKGITVNPEDRNEPVSKADRSVSWRARREDAENNKKSENIKSSDKNQENVKISKNISNSSPIHSPVSHSGSDTIYDSKSPHSVSHSHSINNSVSNSVPLPLNQKKQVHWDSSSDTRAKVSKSVVPEVPYIDVPDVTYSPTAEERQKDKSVEHRGVKWKMKVKDPTKDPDKVEVDDSTVDNSKVVESEISLKGKITSRIKLDPKSFKTSFENSVLDSVLPFLPGEEEVTLFPTNPMSIEELSTEIDVFLLSEEDKVAKLPRGAIIVSDPVLQYYESLALGEEPKQIFVAKASESLRCIYPLINGSLKVESLYDTGSQIVSISEEKAMEAGLSWDPDIVLYMQVHVIRNPAYDLLLGSPFDTLTESCVRTTKDGNKTITIHDPNTHQRAVVPTYARGRGPKILEKKTEQKRKGDEDF
ncbi:hypothetical protein D9757_010240 [Collybiopsis confluens]|uniref:Uncharacterized protein n=1 Tax=Collybiopsis confluens TaxID=2823264 RepID=A0A8H5M433_9AGAR|nr:hypothetical protein D9757_010232 [Collybiopsis confluens]KAF5379971.1 hypothetical protein D9757_010240 [Collybiopsis confluens]